MILGGIARLVASRLRRRPGQWLTIGGAIAAAVALIGILAGLSLGATDQAIRRTLAALDPADRAIQVSVFAPSDAAARADDDAARRALAGLGREVGPAVAGVLFNRARDLHHVDAPDIQVLAADDLARWVTLTSGRLPGPCVADPCEVLLISHGAAADSLPGALTVAVLDLRVVGRATLTSSLPVGRPDLTAEQTLGLDPFDTAPDPPPAFLLAEGTRATAANPGLSTVGRSYRWTAPLDAASVHPWTVAGDGAALGALERQLAATTRDFGVRSPADAIASEVDRGTTAAGRLQLIGALAVAVLIAFAVFAGLVVRADVALEIRRLRRSGAGPLAIAAFLGLEVLAPALGAALVGLVAAVLAVAVLAAATASPIGPLVTEAALAPGTLGAATGVAIGAALGVLAGILFTPRRGFLVGLLPGLLAIGAILGWQLVAGEGLAEQLVRGALGGPVLVLFPAALAFGVAGLFLAVLPATFRTLARRVRGVGLPIRLALLSLARSPARPAATLTLLALSLGALIFAVAYGETVRHGIGDQAAFETGADLRVSEAGTGLILAGTVVPVGRYAALGSGVEAWPILRRAASVAPGGDVTLLGIDPAAIARLAGWRSDFSDLTPAEIGRRLAVAGDFTMPGHRLAADADSLGFDLELAGEPVKLHATVAAPDGDFADIFLGTFLAGHSRIDQALPAGVRGGTLVALRISDSLLVAGPAHPGSLGRSTLRFRGLEGLVADAAPVEAEVGGTVEQVVRAPLPTDGLAIPALVSPGLAAAVDADGTLAVPLGRSVVRVRPVASATRFPTVTGAAEPFIVAAYAPLLLAINGVLPGAGPDEMWLRTPDPAAAAAAVATLGRAPFRAAVVRSRGELEAERAGDPFAAALVWALVAAALAGLLLAGLGLALGVVADLRDDSGELADLETQGLPASAIRALSQARTVLMAVGGIAAGLVAGVLLTMLTTSALALAAGATVPVPALRIVLPWPTIVLVALVPLAAATLLVAVLSRRGQWAGSAPTGRAR